MDDETRFYKTYGEKGVDWDYAKPGEVGKNGLPAVFNTMGKSPIWQDPHQNKAWNHSGPSFWPSTIFEGIARLDGFDHQYMLNEDTDNGYMQIAVREVIPPLTYSAEDGKIMAGSTTETNS